MRVLLFTLYAPMASFGDIAVGERRASWSRPARSAVLGLVAGAMGVDRGDEETHRQLEESLHFGVRTETPGLAMEDYHTVQAARARKGQSFGTRREELLLGNLSTVLSSREWRVDSFFTVALWNRDGAGVDLGDMADALNRPTFVPYVGRKSAPLGLPLNPSVVDADTFLAAFDVRSPTSAEREVLDSVGYDQTAPRLIASDVGVPGIPNDFRVERRRDAVASRARWQFHDRGEAVFAWGGESR
ncbi:MAG: type I-E CRISPR-associated protein Cas5/CasD [Gammaproteobacteria bacterium]|nr:type I-E CRISPR-associated protein Cas5/CasD [Gammaproteobacteria bacterium]